LEQGQGASFLARIKTEGVECLRFGPLQHVQALRETKHRVLDGRLGQRIARTADNVLERSRRHRSGSRARGRSKPAFKDSPPGAIFGAVILPLEQALFICRSGEGLDLAVISEQDILVGDRLRQSRPNGVGRRTLLLSQCAQSGLI